MVGEWWARADRSALRWTWFTRKDGICLVGELAAVIQTVLAPLATQSEQSVDRL